MQRYVIGNNGGKKAEDELLYQENEIMVKMNVVLSYGIIAFTLSYRFLSSRRCFSGAEYLIIRGNLY
jgi:hypothetical protein